jgi:P4 family phage/plasmid primase-like protien
MEITEKDTSSLFDLVISKQFIITKKVLKNNETELLPFNHLTEEPSSLENSDIYTDRISASIASHAYGDNYSVSFALKPNDSFFILKVDIGSAPLELSIKDSTYFQNLFAGALSWLSVNNSHLFFLANSRGLHRHSNIKSESIELIIDNYFIDLNSLKSARGNPMLDCTESLNSLHKSHYIPNASHLTDTISDACSKDNEPEPLSKDVIDICEIENIKSEPVTGLTGDQLNDANRIIDSTFAHKLVNLDNNIHFYNGRDSQPLDGNVARRLIGLAMEGGIFKVTQTRIKGTYSVLKDQIQNSGRPDPVDSKIYFKDCVFNLIINEIEKHNIENKNTRTLSVDYSESSECPKFIEWLNDIFEGEVERVEYLQELLGWTLCRDNLGIEKAIMMIGPPRAGKGIVVRIIRALHGKGATSLNLGELDDNKRLSAMMNAHIAIDSDAVGPSKSNAKAVMGLFKVITSNEPIGVKQLYIQKPVEGPLNCKLCIAANSAPIMFDNSAATANRWLPLVFDKSFLGKEDPDLFKVIEDELAGIASWALLGLKRLVERKKFILPKSSLNQIELLISDSGNIHDFISEELTINKDLRCRESEVWDKYVLWAFREGHDKGNRPLIIKSIEDAMRSQGVKRAKSIKMSDGKWDRGFYGIKPKNEIIPMNVSHLNLSS